MSSFFVVDDKYVPLFRIMWISAVPHFCGEDDCQREGFYEVRLEQGEAVWANQKERDGLLTALEAWSEGQPPPEDDHWQP